MKAKRGTLSLSETKAFLRFPAEQRGDQKMGWEEKWWTYLLSETVPPDLAEFGKDLQFRYHFDDRADVIRYTANDVIDRLSPPAR